MLPVLSLAGDGGEHRMSDVVDTLANQLKLTESEREELLPSGKHRLQQSSPLGEDISRASEIVGQYTTRLF